MTNELIRDRAFFLFLMNGSSFNEIAKQIREEFGTKTTSKSIESWAKKKDPAGQTWEDRRTAIHSKARVNVEVIAENKLSQIKARSNQILDNLYNALVSEKAPEIKTFEGAVFAFKSLSEFAIKLENSENESRHPMLVVRAILEVFQECSPVAKAIQANWDRLSPEIRKKLLVDERK